MSENGLHFKRGAESSTYDVPWLACWESKKQVGNELKDSDNSNKEVDSADIDFQKMLEELEFR